MRPHSLALIFALALPLLGTAPVRSTWQSWATELTGESAARRAAAIAELKNFPALEETLRLELGGRDRFLALDVVSALQIAELVPDLARLAEKDTSGFFYVALNSFVAKKPDLVKVYAERLTHPACPPAAAMVILDTLGRLGANLNRGVLSALLKHPSPEVRSAALYYLRLILLRAPRPELKPLVAASLLTTPYQVRVQAWHLVKELGLKTADFAALARAACAEEKRPEVRAVCEPMVSAP